MVEMEGSRGVRCVRVGVLEAVWGTSGGVGGTGCTFGTRDAWWRRRWWRRWWRWWRGDADHAAGYSGGWIFAWVCGFADYAVVGVCDTAGRYADSWGVDERGVCGGAGYADSGG